MRRDQETQPNNQTALHVAMMDTPNAWGLAIRPQTVPQQRAHGIDKGLLFVAPELTTVALDILFMFGADVTDHGDFDRDGTRVKKIAFVAPRAEWPEMMRLLQLRTTADTYAGRIVSANGRFKLNVIALNEIGILRRFYSTCDALSLEVVKMRAKCRRAAMQGTMLFEIRAIANPRAGCLHPGDLVAAWDAVAERWGWNVCFESNDSTVSWGH